MQFRWGGRTALLRWVGWGVVKHSRWKERDEGQSLPPFFTRQISRPVLPSEWVLIRVNSITRWTKAVSLTIVETSAFKWSVEHKDARWFRWNQIQNHVKCDVAKVLFLICMSRFQAACQRSCCSAEISSDTGSTSAGSCWTSRWTFTLHSA